MRILLTNEFLGSYTGSETWVKTMADELKKNHEVHTFTMNGRDKITGCSVDDGGAYDLALINHNTCLEALKNRQIGTRIFTSHGILPDIEQPKPGADVYIAVSEEVQEHLQQKGFESRVIRNPIDTHQFREVRPREQLENILVISHHNDNLPLIKQACAGYKLECVGGSKMVSNIEEYIGDADLVITLGRGCYEALAMGKNVIVYDYNGGDGYVTRETIYEYRKHNCSGRRFKKNYTVEELTQEIQKYDPNNSLRNYIEQEHDVSHIVKQYLTLLKVTL